MVHCIVAHQLSFYTLSTRSPEVIRAACILVLRLHRLLQRAQEVHLLIEQLLNGHYPILLDIHVVYLHHGKL